MSNRLKVLISAYACEPGKGSEQEVGWQWALEMARFHDVFVVTRTNNREPIEAALATLQGQQPLPRFFYHDRGEGFLRMKRQAGMLKPYYLLWQKSAREFIGQLHEIFRFDLMHHVTFAGFRYPVAIWGHGVPTVWGPIGGIESIPRALLPWHHPASLMHEMVRNANNLLQATPIHVLPRRARATSVILVSTPEMQRAFRRLGFESQLMPTIGLHVETFGPVVSKPPPSGPLRMLFVGNIITLKGVDLALDALAQSGLDATFTLIGSGNYLEAAKHKAAALGIEDLVIFPGRLTRAEVLEQYKKYDLFLFPSLHDTGGYAVIEAMSNQLPVVCLDCGGPSVAVADGCGIRVPLGVRAKVVAGLAEALRWYDTHRQALREHGNNARRRVAEEYDWPRKAARMNEVYQLAMHRKGTPEVPHQESESYSGMGAFANMLHRFVSLKGLAVAAVGLLLIGTLGFWSISQLKHDARNIVFDTLPGLSDAGQADANLTHGFSRTVLALMVDDPAERARLEKDIDTYSRQTTIDLAAYEASIYEPSDRRLFGELIKARVDYSSLRGRVLALADSGRKAEAVAMCQEKLLPAFNLYKEKADSMFAYNIRQGEQRGRAIMAVCTLTQWSVAAVGVMVFVVGFLIGMFK